MVERFFLAAAVFLIGLGFGVLLSVYAFDVERQNAIEAGVARYECDWKTGGCEFTYITPDKCDG